MLDTHSARPAPTSSHFAVYLREIDETPLLSAEEERELAYRIEEGDPEAREHLVRANLRLVVNIARKYQDRGLDLPDLIAEGNLGLLRAAEGYDASMNTRFSTYAVYWVKQSIRRALLNMAGTIRVPAYMAQLLVEWRRASAALHEELGRPPAEEEVARRLELSPRQLRLIKKAIRIHQGTSQRESSDTGTLEELVADDRNLTPEADLARSDELREVLRRVDELPERERAVLRLRFGLDGTEPLTLHEIGARLHLTRERVRQIEREALSKLQEMLLAG
jgi:RNA polymerase primary sigma factor